MRTLVWFRGKDLRLGDHAPLHDAIAGGEAILLFVLDPHFFAPERAKEMPHRVQFLLESLRELARAIEDRGSRLVVLEGRSVEVVPRLARAWKVDRVLAHRWTEPVGRERDAKIARALDVPFMLYEGETLAPPESVRTKAGAPFSVFSPFAREHARVRAVEAPLPAPRRIPPPPIDVASAPIPTIDDLGAPSNRAILAGGERAARARLAAFVRGPAKKYAAERDRMDLPGTSRLSADLKFGTISVRAVWAETKQHTVFANELVWREFAYATLWDRPSVLTEPFDARWRGFPWRADERAWDAWVRGATGYPIVDASARQLLAEGFVHNRARMISASFLTKHLLLDLRRGEAHYMKWLTDGDWASNDLGWQWSAGSGCDAQPYFRVFNPVAQGERFDPTGDYVRRWVPELAKLPTAWIHAPWTAPPLELRAAGVTLGREYPAPIVDHREARARFLETAAAHLKR